MNIFILAAGFIDPNMSWDTYWANFWVSIEILWKGLLAIAIVMIAVIVVTMIMNSISKKNAEKKAKEEQEKTE